MSIFLTIHVQQNQMCINVYTRIFTGPVLKLESSNISGKNKHTEECQAAFKKTKNQKPKPHLARPGGHHTPLIPALRKQRQTGLGESEISLFYMQFQTSQRYKRTPGLKSKQIISLSLYLCVKGRSHTAKSSKAYLRRSLPFMEQ